MLSQYMILISFIPFFPSFLSPPLPFTQLLCFLPPHHLLALHTERLTRAVFIFVRGSAESLTSFLTIGTAGSKVWPDTPSGFAYFFSSM